MTANEAPWFIVGPAARRRGKLIKVPLTYNRAEALRAARVFVLGEHIQGVSSEGGARFSSVAELGDLVPGKQFWLVLLTDGEPAPLKFVLDLVDGERHLRKLIVEAPEPESMPVITEQSVD